MAEALSAKGITDELWQSLFSFDKADLSIVCSDEITIRCNRTALGAASHYFHCLLSRDWLEGSSQCISLPSVTSHLLQDYMISFFKTGLTPPAAFADDLMVVMEAFELARGYNVQRLEQLLLKQLLLRMDIISAGWILARALDIQAFDLVGVAVDFLARAWCMGVTGVAISGMLPDALIQYLQSPLPRHNRVPEEYILEAVIEWGKQHLGLGIQGQQSEMEEADKIRLADLLQPLLHRIKLEAVPPGILERRVEAMGLLSPKELLEIYKAQAKLALPERPKTHVRSFWDTDCLVPSINLLDSATAQFLAARGHSAVRSKLCLTRGRWKWKLRVNTIGKRYAWAGVVDGTVKLDFFPGSQVGGYMFGSGGATISKGPDNRDLEKYGVPWHKDGSEITVHLDMEARTCGFSIDDTYLGLAFLNLPPCVYPAASMGKGGEFRFLYISSACGEEDPVCKAGKAGKI